ncbi:response regulator [Leptolyngbya ohadii]|uniref:response regulator n=1 Tax=Leptolyngbya ohadii TaxID=1962290 RepID=UPI000B59F778|nr:response regulator [Leptolyngbya ohadii]
MTRTILVVDDEEDVREIVSMGLEMGAGWHILTASSGREAITIAAEEQPDAILLDLMMPDMDGRATLQQLKANAATRSIPVLLVTAKMQQSTQTELQKLQVEAVLAKPFRPLKLAEQIRAALGWS